MKKITTIFCTLFIIAFCSFPTFAAEKLNVIDNANILTSTEEEKLTKTINDISKQYKLDIVILTENSIGLSTAKMHCENYYNNNNYGVGDNKDGMILLINMNNNQIGNRDCYIATKGYVKTAIDDNYGINYTLDKIIPLLKDDKYTDGFNKALSISKDFLKQYESGEPYSSSNKVGYDVIKICIVLAISLAVSLTTVLIMKSKHNNVHFQSHANEYIEKGSFKLTSRQDSYLYSTVTKVPIPKSSNNNTASSSSSGGGFGGGGRKF